MKKILFGLFSAVIVIVFFVLAYRTLQSSLVDPDKMPTMLIPEAIKIADETPEAKAFRALQDGRFKDCLDVKAVRPCDSDWVTCIDDAWVIQYELTPECGVTHDGRLTLRLLVGSDGKIISRFPEKEYFINPDYCLEDYDCMTIASENVNSCRNFVFAQLADESLKGGCLCVRHQCSPK